MSSQYGELRPSNGWDRFGSFGHPSKFQRVSRLGFITAPTSLNEGQQNFAGCLAVSWAGTLYIHFGDSCPLTEFCQLQKFASKSCVLLCWQRYSTALEQRPPAKLCGVVQGMKLRNFRRRRHLYSAGRPSRWASAHISSYDYHYSPYTGRHTEHSKAYWYFTLRRHTCTVYRVVWSSKRQTLTLHGAKRRLRNR